MYDFCYDFIRPFLFQIRPTFSRLHIKYMMWSHGRVSVATEESHYKSDSMKINSVFQFAYKWKSVMQWTVALSILFRCYLHSCPMFRDLIVILCYDIHSVIQISYFHISRRDYRSGTLNPGPWSWQIIIKPLSFLLQKKKILQDL